MRGNLYHGYTTLLPFIALLWNTVIITRAVKLKRVKRAFKDVYFGVGIQLFLFTFFTIVWLAGYLTTIGVFENSDLEFYGLYGMAIFLLFIGILMTKFDF